MIKPNIQLMHDLVMIRPMPLHLKKTADGIIVPGDTDKMAPKRATVVASGPGTYVKDKFVANPFKVGDQILYMERDLIPAKVEGEDYTILKAQDVIVKLGFKDPGPDETLPEMSDAAYFAETMRRSVIAHLKDCGLERVQDMANPVENFIASDGDTVTVTARSFMVTTPDDLVGYVPPEDAKAFSMYTINFTVVEDTPHVVVRLAFLPRSDVTLG